MSSAYLDSRATSNSALELEHGPADLVLHGRLAALVMDRSTSSALAEETTSVSTSSRGCGHGAVMVLARSATPEDAAAGAGGGCAVGVVGASKRHGCCLGVCCLCMVVCVVW